MRARGVVRERSRTGRTLLALFGSTATTRSFLTLLFNGADGLFGVLDWGAAALMA